MRKTKRASAILVAVFLSGPAAVPADEPPPFKISTQRDDDRVEVQAEKDRTVISVRSPVGISHATIERRTAAWPERVVLRLHLHGLEFFLATNGKVTLAAAVSSTNPDSRLRVWLDNREDVRLDAKHPLFLPIRLVDATGKTTNAIPLRDGHFEVPLPPAFFADNPKSITATWIDFYRN